MTFGGHYGSHIKNIKNAGYKPVPPVWFRICVGFITGTPKGSPKVVFMEKPGIEPATPGLQGIAFLGHSMC